MPAVRGHPLASWREEVLGGPLHCRDALPASRHCRCMDTEVPAIDHSVPTPGDGPLLSIAWRTVVSTAGISNAAGTDLRSFSPLRGVFAPLIRLPFFLLMLPIALYALGAQIAMGRLLGDSTDEGLDARTSYHFLSAMFGSLMFWPILTCIVVWLALNNTTALQDVLGFDWTLVYGAGSGARTMATATLVTACPLCLSG